MFSLTNTDDKKDPEKISNFGTTIYGKTNADFFTGERYAKYLVKTESKLIGDRQLFESEIKRSQRSRVNWINWILSTFLIL